MQQILPESQSLGSFHPHTLILELDRTSQRALQDSLNHLFINKPAQILAHELCHWIDIVGTVWGQDYLDDVFAALDSVSVDDPVKSYPFLLRLFDRDRTILLPRYYKVVNDAALPTNSKDPWKISYSCGAWITPAGHLDENKPIFFVRFNDRFDDTLVSRQPITIGALLELRSVAAEVATFDHWLEGQALDEQTIATALFRRERIAEFYDPLFTTYSVAAHLLSVKTEQPDFSSTCLNGAVIADLCLNLVPKSFVRLRHPSAMRSGFSPQRLGGFKLNEDRGYLFACMAFFADELGIRNLNREAVASLTEQAGIGTPESIYAEAERYLEKKQSTLSILRDSNIRRIRTHLLAKGLEILRWRRLAGGNIRTVQEYINLDLPTPVIITGDCEMLKIGANAMSLDDGEILHATDLQLRDRTRDGLRAGRGLDFGFPDYVY
ncbi:MAG: hypothetical protein WB624_21840 [Xanthobacteraceae bacterium]|jgi:hypothetical protein